MVLLLLLLLYCNLTGKSRFLRIHASYIRTLTIKRAFSTIGALRVAYLAAMTDEVDVQRVYPVRWHRSGKDVVRLICIHLWPNQPQAFRDAENMGIYTHLWLSFFQKNGDTVCRCSTACCQAPPSKEAGNKAIPQEQKDANAHLSCICKSATVEYVQTINEVIGNRKCQRQLSRPFT